MDEEEVDEYGRPHGERTLDRYVKVVIALAVTITVEKVYNHWVIDRRKTDIEI